MQEYLLDSNILIYLLEENFKVRSVLAKLKREYFFVSTISIVEVQWGARSKKELESFTRFTREFAPLDLRTGIAEAAVKLSKQDKKIKFKDLLIAATAQAEGLTLVTADKDFTKIKGLKVKLIKLN